MSRARDVVRRHKRLLTAREKPASWYDHVYGRSEEYRRPYAESVYITLWREIARRLQTAGVRAIVDLGCGPGQLAALLADEGFARYVGVDFSSTAIAMARARCPAFDFRVADVNALDPSTLPAHDVVISTELLEHVKGDVALLSRLGAGTRFIGTVPSFDSESHVRYFLDAGQVVGRYARLFGSFEVEERTLENGARLFLIDGVRRSA